jgi:uncharacterized protein YjbI with pentapeptide repeats
MAHLDHSNKINKGVKAWNAWRREHPAVTPDLSRIDLSRCDLRGADLRGADLKNAELEEATLGHSRLPTFMTRGGLSAPANLSGANLTQANLPKADLTNVDLSDSLLAGADLRGAILRGARLDRADLTGAFLNNADLRGASLKKARLGAAQLAEADLTNADLQGANLFEAHLGNAKLHGSNLEASDLTGADLSAAELDSADLSRSLLVDACLSGATLNGARVYGISVWNVDLEGVKQEGLIVTPHDEPTVTVDHLEVAQFIYLLLRREKLRDVINAMTSKAVLILGRFTPERKRVLDVIAHQLRINNLLPIIFDFERSTARDLTETIKTLASLSLFVIVDLTNPKSAPLELQATVPDYQIPFIPVIQEGEDPFSMFNDLWVKYKKWMLEPVNYSSPDTLVLIFETAILDRAWEKHRELQKAKAEEVRVLSWKDFLKEEKVQDEHSNSPL